MKVEYLKGKLKANMVWFLFSFFRSDESPVWALEAFPTGSDNSRNGHTGSLGVPTCKRDKLCMGESICLWQNRYEKGF